MHPCADPLLACQRADPVAGDMAGPAIGFTVPLTEPPDATYCSPRRCATDKDCAPAGRCPPVDGGTPWCTP